MAITKQTVVDQTTITENGIILYREATKIIEDGVELTKDLPSYIVDTGTGLNRATRTGCSYCEYGVDCGGYCGISSNARGEQAI
jgi:hypothetical protein